MTDIIRKTYGSITYQPQETRWLITELEPHVSIKLKKLFPKIGSTAILPYSIQASDELSADLSWFIIRYPLKMSECDRNLLSALEVEYHQGIAKNEQILLPSWVSTLSIRINEDRELFGYQKQAVQLLANVKRLLLGDTMGLGKTISAIGSMLIPGALPAAVVVQSHMTKHWKDKIEEFTCLSVHIIEKSQAYTLPICDVYIFKYGSLSGWVDIFNTRLIKLVVFDEIQELRRGFETVKGSSSKVLADNAEYVLGLSGTPVMNYGIEIFNIIDGFIKPGMLGNREEFMREWCANTNSSLMNVKVVKDAKALGSYLRDQHVLLRRTRKDVGMTVTGKNTIIEKLPHDYELIKSSEELAKRLAISTLSGSYVDRGMAAREFDIRMRQNTGISKAKYVANYARLMIESGEPVILAGWHREVYEIWLRELNDFKPAMFTGSETPKQKENEKQRFLNGDTDLLVMSLRSGVGVDGLQARCNVILIGELDWSPKIHEQIIARVDRIGQKNNVSIVYLVTDYGSDPVIIDMLGLKNSQADGITDPEAKIEIVQSDSGRISKLARTFLQSKGIVVPAQGSELLRSQVEVV